jgi:hypothetical protein
LCGEGVEHREGLSDQSRINALDDENQSRSPVRVRPTIKVIGSMDKALDAMDRHRPIFALEREDTFHAQNILPMPIEQHG